MKYLVTGGHGFIGRHLVNRLVKDGHEVTVVDLAGDFPLRDEYHFVYADISGGNYNNKIMEALDGVDAVFHLAAKARVQPSIEHPVEFNKTNVEGTLALLEMCRHQGVKRFVFSSSSSIYGDTETFPTPETAPKKPLSPYGLQKLIGEQYCELYSEIHNIETVCLRYFNVYGENAPTEGAYCLVIGKFIQQIREGKNLTIFGDGEQRRDFTYVQDVVQANILAATTEGVSGKSFNIGNGDNRSINQISEVFQKHPATKAIDYLESRTEPKVTLADNSKAKKLLGWEPSGDVIEWLNGYLYPDESVLPLS
jgi:UDP-glucose 4-epimerase